MPEQHGGRFADVDLSELAEAAAEKAVAKVFKRLRIKIDDDDSMDAFVDNQRFLTDLRAGTGRVKDGVKSAGLDVIKQVTRYALLIGLVALGASVGVHFQTPTLPTALIGKP